MNVIKDNFKSKLEYKTIIALGSFDGFHLGHMSLINRVKELSRESGCKSMVITFENHPLSTINPNFVPKLLMSNAMRIDFLKENGIDVLNLMQFNEEFMKICPEEFVEKLVQTYNPVAIVVGFNYRFGYKNLGDVELLKKIGEKNGFETHVLEPVKYNEEVICSTRIRGLIKEGNVELANELLGRHFTLEGKVIDGKKLGRTIGFPTINLEYSLDYITPRGGVYYTNVLYREKIYKGITNIGYNPTVNGNKLSIETFILDFSECIYGEEVKVAFGKRIRDEKKFNSLEELKKQLDDDKDFARQEKFFL